MKATWGLVVLVSILTSSAFAQRASVVPSKEITPAVIERGRDHRLWQTVSEVTDEEGVTTLKTNVIQEIATGLHYLDGNEWKESTSEIEVFPDGAIARHSGVKIIFGANLNTAGVIDLLTEDGRRFQSHPLGIAYYNRVTGESVWIATVQDSIGQLLPGKDKILYPDAFSGIQADLVFTHSRSHFESDLVIRDRELPSPRNYGLDPATTVVELVTEFIGAPVPVKSDRWLATDVADEVLDFGRMSIVSGKSFSLMDLERDSSAVSKAWRTVGQRTYLMESIAFSALQEKLASLPVRKEARAAAPRPQAKATKDRQFPASPPVASSRPRKPVQVAMAPLDPKGVVLDYVLVATDTNVTFFNTSTYFVSGQVNLSGTTVMQPWVVIKYTNGAQIKILGSLVTPTNQYMPVIMTAMDDDTIGEGIPGTTGTPSGYYADAALYLDAATAGASFNVSNLRINYAKTGVRFYTGETNVVRHSQILNAEKAIQADTTSMSIQNVLLYNSLTNFYGINFTGRCEQVTVDVATVLGYDTVSSANSWLGFTNSLLVAITNTGAITRSTNYCYEVADGSALFNPTYMGLHYLTNSAIGIDLGTTNITASLLSDLRKRTTVAPLVMTNVTYTTNVTFDIIATRDTNSLDYGYHYDPIDVLGSWVIVTNSTMFITNGAVFGLYGATAFIPRAGKLMINGDPLHHSAIVKSTYVQEKAVSDFNFTVFSDYMATNLAGQEFTANFTDLFVKGTSIVQSGSYGSRIKKFELNNSQVYGGLIKRGTFRLTWTAVNGRVMNFTNTLFVGVTIQFMEGAESITNHWRNNLFVNSFVTNSTGNPIGSIKDNVFDRTPVTLAGITCDYNGFITNFLKTSSSTHDIIRTNFDYDVGPLGIYYIPTNSPLVDAGSQYATNAGLYHFTTATNQVKEAGTKVDIGLHYVALDTSGLPVDTDGDLLYDYLEDKSGNGSVESGETSWTDASPTISITAPSNGQLFVVSPTNLTLTATASDNGTVTNVSFYYGTTFIGRVTNSPYTLTWSNAAGGSYSLTGRATDNLGATTISAPVSITVNAMPAITLTNPASGSAMLHSPTNILLEVSASDADGSITNVSFYNGASLLGQSTNAPFNLTWSNVLGGSYSLSAVATDDRGAQTTSAVVNVGVNGGLDFGTNSYVTFGSNTNLGVKLFTLECWFKRTGAGMTTYTGAGGMNAVPLITKGRSQDDGSNIDVNYFLGIDSSGVIAADFESYVSGTNYPVRGITTISNGVWYHAAVAYNGTNWQLYLNGELEADLGVGTNSTGTLPRYDSIHQIALATAYDSNGQKDGAFWGAMDEVRIWNYARTRQQIRDSMNLQLAPECGLIACWALNEGTGSSVSNSAGTTISGSVSNFVGSTPAWNWINSAPFSAGGAALFVVGDTNLSAPDSAIKARLLSLNYNVTAMASTNVASSDASRKTLVVISSSATATNVNTKFRTNAVPVVTWNQDVYDDLGMVTSNSSYHGTVASQTQLDIVKPDHELAAGLTGTTAVVSNPCTFAWAYLTNTAIRVGTIEDLPDIYAVFGYEQGVRMPELVAPARRVGLPWTDSAVTNLNANGWSIFDAAIRWASEKPCPPVAEVVLVIEHSSAMTGTPLAAAKYDGKYIATNLNLSLDQVAVVSFDSDSTVNTNLTHSILAVTDAVDAIANSSGSYLDKGINAAQDILNGSNHIVGAAQVMVILTVGAPSGDTNLSVYAASQAKLAGTRIITIGMSSSNAFHLQNLASSCVDYYANPNDGQLDQIVASITNSLCRAPLNQPPSVEIINLTDGQFFATTPTNILVQVSATDSDGSVVRVELYDGTNVIAISTAAPYDFIIPSRSGGTNQLKARAFDNLAAQADSASIGIMINQPLTVSLTSPTNGNVFVEPPSITLSATAVDTGTGVVSTVQFLTNGVLFAEDSSPPYSVTWSSPPAGIHTIQARGIDNSGAARLSAVATVTVRQDQPPYVDAGSNLTIRLPSFATLNGAVIDDNIPVGYGIGSYWTNSYGPGTVTFTNGNKPAATASFSAPGLYYLTLVATNSVYRIGRTITVDVQPAGATNLIFTISPLDAGVIMDTNPVAFTATLLKAGGYPYVGVPVQFETWGTFSRTDTIVTDGRGLATFWLTNNTGVAGDMNYIKATTIINGASQSTTNAQVFWNQRHISVAQLPCSVLLDGTIEDPYFTAGAIYLGQGTTATISITNHTGTGAGIEIFSTSGKSLTNVYSQSITITNVSYIAPKAGWYVVEGKFYDMGPFEYHLDIVACSSISELDIYSGVDVNPGTQLPNGYTFDFGLVTVGGTYDQIITITNSGNAPLNLFSVNLVGPFTLSPNETAPSLDNDHTNRIQYTIHFSPTAPGLYSGDLYIKSEDQFYDTFDERNMHLNLRARAVISSGPPVVVISNPLDASQIGSCTSNLSLTVEVFDSGSISWVEYYEGAELIGTNASAPFDFSWSTIPAGTHTIAAVAVNGGGLSSTSAPVTFSIGLPVVALTQSNSCPKLLTDVHLVTVTLTNCSGTALEGTNILFNVTGANPTNYSVTTDASGLAQFAYTAGHAGVDVIQASTTIGGLTVTSQSVSNNWAVPIPAGQVVSALLSSTNGFSQSSSGRNAAYYSFTAAAGREILVTMTSKDFDTVLFLRRGNCDVIVTNDDDYFSENFYTQVGVLLDSQIHLDSTNQAVSYVIEASTFDPGASGVYRVWWEYYDPTHSPEIYAYTGATPIPNNATVVFGPIDTNTTATQTIVFTNSGTMTLTNGVIQLTGPFSSPNTSSVTIPYMGSNVVSVTFNPSPIYGTQSGTLWFYNNDGDGGDGFENPFVINLVGVANPTGAAPTVSLTSPTNNAVYKIPANSTEVNFGIYSFQGDSIAVKVPLSASATPSSGKTITNVEFYVTGSGGRTFIGRKASAPYTATWAASVLGTYYLTAVVTETSGRTTVSDPITVVIDLGGNHKPVANTDFPTVFMNSVGNVFNVLTNDTDVDGDELTIISVQNTKLGSPTITNNGKAIRYTPPPFYYGQENFSYTISDGQGGTATAWVIVEVPVGDNPDISVASPAEGFTTNAGNHVLIVAHSLQSNSVSKVEFYVNGDKVGEDASGPAFTFDWTPMRVGENSLNITATDDVGRISSSATVIVTNTAPYGDTAPIASFLNLTNQVQLIGVRSVTNTPVVRDGLFVLTGSAYDPDSSDNPTVTYRLRLLQPDGAYLADLTPPPLTDTGFHMGSVNNGTLATNDFTFLRNGAYRLELTVRGGYQEIVTNVSFVLDSELKVGQFSFSQQDIVIPVNGLPLAVTRTYSTLNPNTGDFGFGWTYSINDVDMAIAEDREDLPDFETEEAFSRRFGGSRDVTLTLPDGRRTTFFYYLEPTPSSGDVPSFSYQAKWAPAPGVYDKLEALGDATLNTVPGYPAFWNATGSGTPMESFDFPGFLLTLRDGTQFRIEREDLGEHFVEEPDQPGLFSFVQSYGRGVLKQITQRTGDKIVIGLNSIQHYDATNQPTRSVVFERDGFNRIIAIRDPNSTDTATPATVKYAYNNDGNLISVAKLVDRTFGTYLTTSYEYDDTNHTHYITGIKDPRGVTPMRTLYDTGGRMIGTIDAYGKTNTFSHDVVGRTETVYDRNGNSSVHVYDARGNIVSSTDALGRTTQRTYDLLNNVLMEIDPLLNTNSYAYDASGNRIFSTNAPGHVTAMTYNTNGQVLTVTDPRGNTTWNTYDPIFGELIATTNALGEVTRMVYNTNKLLVAQIDALGNVVSNQYDGLGNLTNSASLDSQHSVLSQSSYTYDSNGNRLTESVWRTLNGSGQWLTSSTRYDAENRPVEMVDALGQTNRVIFNEIGQQSATADKLGRATTYAYSLRGELLSTTYPDLATESTVYDDDGRRIASINRLGYTNRFEYDAVGRLTNSINPDLTHNSTIYDAAGRVFQNIDARGFTNSYAYDGAGRRTFVTNALGQVSQYTYDANGNQLVFTDANLNSTTNVYDALNRQVQVFFPDGTLKQTFYDVMGRRIVETDQATNSVWFGYDGLGRLTSVTNMLVQVTRYGYDETGLQTNQVDALGRVTAFAYDSLGRRNRRILPGGQSESYFYDAGGNMTRHTNFNGVITTNLYDVMNRLQARIYADGTSNTFTYSASGQRLSQADRSGSYSYVYDTRDRLTNASTPAGILNYRYDANGNITTVASLTSGGTLITNQFDALNRLTNVIDARLSGTQNTAYRFDAVGNLQSLAYPNGVTNLYQYTSLNRLTNLAWKLNGSQRGDFTYQLGLAGNRTNLSDNVNGTSRTFNWQFDQLYRLTNEVVSGGTSGSLGYAYDSVGNRTNRTGTLGSLGAVTSSYNTNDWLTGDVYDNNGNTRTNSSQPYFYDAENRLTNFNNGAVIITYDADGNRVKKVSGGTTTLYLVDSHNLTGYAQVLEELTVSGGTTNLAKVYSYGLDLISQRVPTTSTNFFGYDGLGSTRFLLNAGGALVEHYAYDAYGTLIASNATPSTVYLFAGEQFDPDLGLYYNRARYLKTDTGRFLTMDCYEGAKSDVLSLHKYLYAHGNSVNGTDPNGHDFELAGVSAIMNFGLFGAITPSHLSSREYMAPLGYKGCSKSEVIQIKSAVKEAKQYAAEAVYYLGSISYNTAELRYWRWFGSSHAGRFQHVKHVWEKIDSALNSGNLIYEAHQPEYFKSNMDYFGDVHPFREAIRLGSQFWLANLTGEDSKAGTIIHELSHKFGGTGDKDYGSDACKALAKTNPNAAIYNADNYEYFSELK